MAGSGWLPGPLVLPGQLETQAGSITTPFWAPLSLPQLVSVLSMYGPGCSSPQGLTDAE